MMPPVVGKLQQLRRWWDKLNEVGPAFGYFPNATKTWLVVKETELAAAQEAFPWEWSANHG